MPPQRKKKPSKVKNGKVHVKAYTRKPGKLPARNTRGRFTRKTRGKAPGQSTLF